MTGSTKNIVKQLYQAGSLETVSIAELEELVAANPVFSAGHYLLSKKLLQDGAASFTRQTQKTALYFSNPFWLHWLLKNVKDDNAEAALEPAPVLSEQEPTAEQVPNIPETFATAHEFEQVEVTTSVIEEDAAVQQETASVPIVEKIPETVSTDAAELVVVATEPVAVMEQQASATEIVVENKDTEADEIGGHISRIVTQQVEDAAKAIKPEALAFEPYHTVDYFASQGIKFVQETNPDDKLGRQLKSFTEWLKIMKKLPRQTAEQSIADETAQANIAINAAESIEDKEVVTEAMAEVLIKQGKTEKAADVYRKLSLLNPDKSVYFAARIEQLKVH